MNEKIEKGLVIEGEFYVVDEEIKTYKYDSVAPVVICFVVGIIYGFILINT